MSISFSGVGSGLPIDEWITAFVKVEQDKVDSLTDQRDALTDKQNILNSLSSEYSAVQSATLTFTDSLLGAGSDIFSKVSVSASDTSVVTATVTQFATPATIELEIESLASSSIKTSEYNEALKDSSKKLSDLGVTTAGNFQINGATINVTPDMTIDSLVYQINSSTSANVKASLKNGRLVLENREAGTQQVEVTGTDLVDGTHNFAELLGLDKTSSAQNSKKNDLLNTGSTTLAELGVEQDGNININGTAINITTDMTVDEFISAVNSSDAGVTASVQNGIMVLENTDGSNDPIDMNSSNVAGSRNIAELMGFTSYNDSGTNAVFYLNGDRKESTSNSVSSDVTGILGLSLDLLTTTDGDPITIEITRDYDSEEPLTALQTFVEAFNKIVTDTNLYTDSDSTEKNGGILSGENNLVRIKNSLRTLVTSTVENSGQYKSLADIGITTGAPGLDVSADTTQLIIDEEKFLDAYEKDPSSVKALLVGDNSSGTTQEGLMQKLQTQLEAATDRTSGYFAARSDSLSSQISSMNDKIDRKQEYVYSYQEKLTNQFNYMDQMIAQMNSQFTAMQQQLASIGVNMGSSS